MLHLRTGCNCYFPSFCLPDSLNFIFSQTSQILNSEVFIRTWLAVAISFISPWYQHDPLWLAERKTSSIYVRESLVYHTRPQPVLQKSFLVLLCLRCFSFSHLEFNVQDEVHCPLEFLPASVQILEVLRILTSLCPFLLSTMQVDIAIDADISCSNSSSCFSLASEIVWPSSKVLAW